MEKTDILVFMTDQHTPYYTGYYGDNVDTPNLDKMCSQGTRFDEAYTACPLCVPARMSMLSGRQSSNLGIFTNFDALADITPTFLHNLVISGYETVLAGRMHFVGADQRHGFTKRIAPDMTAVTWRRPVEKLREERGVFSRTFAAGFSGEAVGGGESPVLYYDEMVIQSVLNYLNEPHEKPQFIMVGLYAPHFPYVAPKQLFEKYIERVHLPKTFYTSKYHEIPVLEAKRQKRLTEEVALACQAAYCGMIENMDRQLGIVMKAFEEFVESRGNKKICCYLSDHGDHVGDKRMLGKQTFFEKSAKIPLIFTGDGIKSGKVVTDAVSIISLGPTILEIVGARPMEYTDGESLADYLTKKGVSHNRHVVCEFIERGNDGDYIYAIMVKQGDWKWIGYHGYEEHEMLFNTKDDPDEQFNLVNEKSQMAEKLRNYGKQVANPEQVEKEHAYHAYRTEIFRKVEDQTGYCEDERWQENPETAKGMPEIAFSILP